MVRRQEPRAFLDWRLRRIMLVNVVKLINVFFVNKVANVVKVVKLVNVAGVFIGGFTVKITGAVL